jgi:hypothetical protein
MDKHDTKKRDKLYKTMILQTQCHNLRCLGLFLHMYLSKICATVWHTDVNVTKSTLHAHF